LLLLYYLGAARTIFAAFFCGLEAVLVLGEIAR